MVEVTAFTGITDSRRASPENCRRRLGWVALPTRLTVSSTGQSKAGKGGKGGGCCPSPSPSVFLAGPLPGPQRRNIHVPLGP